MIALDFSQFFFFISSRRDSLIVNFPLSIVNLILATHRGGSMGRLRMERSDQFFLLPAARTAEITTLPLISDTGAPLEQSQTTLLKP